MAYVETFPIDENNVRIHNYVLCTIRFLIVFSLGVKGDGTCCAKKLKLRFVSRVKIHRVLYSSCFAHRAFMVEFWYLDPFPRFRKKMFALTVFILAFLSTFQVSTLFEIKLSLRI